MDYLNKTESLLKSCLKGKRKITTATVVAFMIMGIGAFAQGKEGGETGTKKPVYTVSDAAEWQVKLSGENAPEGFEEITADERYISLEKMLEKKLEGITLNGNTITSEIDLKIGDTTEGRHSVIGLVAQDGKTVINKGELTIGKGSVGMYGIESADGKEKQINGENSFVEKGGTPVFVGTKAAKTRVENAGKIAVSGENAVGMNIGIGTTAVNQKDGTIEVTGKNAAGMRAYSQAFGTISNEGAEGKAATEKFVLDETEANKRVLLNQGTIKVNGEGAVGMHIATAGKFVDASNEGTIDVVKGTGVKVYDSQTFGTILAGKDETVFTNKGTVKATGENTIGMTVDDNAKTAVKLINDGEIEVSNDNAKGVVLNNVNAVFENNKNIKVSAGTGIDLTNGKAVNNGTITVEKGIGVDVKGGEFTNNSTIEVALTEDGSAKGVKVGESGKFVNGENGILTSYIPWTEIGPSEEAEEETLTETAKTATLVSGAKTIENAGTILAGKGLTAFGDVAGEEFTLTNTGSIEVENGGILVAKAAEVQRSGSSLTVKVTNKGDFSIEKGGKISDEKVDFTNKAGATLALGENVVLGGSESALTNSGTAEFETGAKIANELGELTNSGILNVQGVEFGEAETEQEQLKAILSAVGASKLNGTDVSGEVSENVLEEAIGIITGTDEEGNEIQIVGGNELAGKNGSADVIFGDGGKAYKVTGGDFSLNGGEAEGKQLNIASKDSGTEQGTAGKVKVTENATLTDFEINIIDTKLTKGSTIEIGTSDGAKTLTLNSSGVNAGNVQTAFTFAHNDSKLVLDNTSVTGNIGADKTKGTLEAFGKTITGDVKVKDFKAVDMSVIGNVEVGTLTTNINEEETKGTTYFGEGAEKGDDVSYSVKADALNTHGTTVFDIDVAIGSAEGAILGETSVVNGHSLILGGDLTVGDKKATEENGRLVFSADSKLKGTNSERTITVEKDGEIVINVGAGKTEDGVYNENALSGSENIKITGDGNLTFAVGNNLTGYEALIDIGDATLEGNQEQVKFDSDIYKFGGLTEGTKGDVIAEYVTDLYKDGILNELHKSAVNVGNYLSHAKDERAEQLDRLYSSNIYSETVRASYDMFKMNEDSVLSMKLAPKAGEVVTAGKALYSKTEYDRDGRFGSRTSENETTGLLANVAYGLNDNSTLGFVFSGAKQDIDTDGGSADGDAFYFGVYKDTTIGKAQVKTGAAYQFSDFDADNTAGSRTVSKSYNSTAVGVYSQATFNNDLGNGLSLQPKVKVGLTHISQDNVTDAYFGVEDAEITTADLTVGADIVKTVNFEKSVADFKVGAGYTYTMGDTDKEFTGSFKGGTDSFDVLGAEIAENVFGINLGAEVSYENGFFYNGGFTYRFGSDDTSAYGINVGVGYSF